MTTQYNLYQDDTNRNVKLPTDVKEKWLTALRSGDYKQVKAALRKLRRDKEIGYCCLGVLSDIFIQDQLALNPNPQCLAKWATEPSLIDKTFPFTDSNGETRETMPTYEVNQWAGRNSNGVGWTVFVDEKDAKKLSPDGMTRNYVTLDNLNDRGYSFKTIAAVIEKYL